MNLPKFLLADNSQFPEDIFVLHTEFPRFMINLKDFLTVEIELVINYILKQTVKVL